MISLKALITVAVMALVVPLAAPAASFAQTPNGGKAVPGGVRPGGAPAARYSGAAPRFFYGNGGRANMAAPVAQASPSGGNWRGNQGWRGNEGWRGDRRRDRDGRFIPGVVAGAVIGGAIASQSYYAPAYADDAYYDDGPVAATPAPAPDDAVTYCIQNFSSYDPASGTYLGNDGYRHPCP